MADYRTAYPSALQAVYAAEARRIHAAFVESTAFDHNGMKGEAREALLNHGLRQHLPGHVEAIQSAKVINAKGDSSLQCDLVIKDKSWPAIASTGRNALVMTELVYGVVEVKSDLTAEELRKACENIRSAKRVYKTQFHPHKDCSTEMHWNAYGKLYPYVPTVGLIFGFSSRTGIDTLCKALWDWCVENSVPAEERPEAVFILGRGAMQWRGEKHIHWRPEPQSHLTFHSIDDDLDVLPTLGLHLHQHFSRAQVPPWRLDAYLGSGMISGPEEWNSNGHF